MALPPGLNSDELVPDEDESILNPFFDVGKKKIDEMLAFAMEDRVSSREELKRGSQSAVNSVVTSWVPRTNCPSMRQLSELEAKQGLVKRRRRSSNIKSFDDDMMG
jgi:hypothetical protein